VRGVPSGKYTSADVQPDDLAEAEAGAEGDREDRVVTRVARGGLQERSLLGVGEG
jgi:hypothetical protein